MMKDSKIDGFRPIGRARLGYLLGALCMMLLGFGCKEKEPPVVRVNPEILPYCWFETGSYWIYEEENTPGLMDSAYVTYHWVENTPDEANQGWEMEHYGNSLMLRGRLYGQGRTAYPFSQDLNQRYTLLHEGAVDSFGRVEDISFFWHPTQSWVAHYRHDTLLSTHLDSVVIQGTSYLDAYEFMHSSYPGGGNTLRVIWARNVGAVLREFSDGTTWVLVRHSVRQ